MDKIKKTVRYNALIRLYGPLLSKTQLTFADDYFSYDLSLSEIADAHGVTRSAVEDAIKKALKKLDNFEKQLKILKTSEKIQLLIAQAKDVEGQEKILLLEEIEAIISNYGI